MKKIRLELDTVQVESFTTSTQTETGRGTVHGHISRVADTCRYPSTSCGDTQTFGEATCNCLYPPTDIRRCCSDVDYCSGGGLC